MANTNIWMASCDGDLNQVKHLIAIENIYIDNIEPEWVIK